MGLFRTSVYYRGCLFALVSVFVLHLNELDNGTIRTVATATNFTDIQDDDADDPDDLAEFERLAEMWLGSDGESDGLVELDDATEEDLDEYLSNGLAEAKAKGQEGWWDRRRRRRRWHHRGGKR